MALPVFMAVDCVTIVTRFFCCVEIGTWISRQSCTEAILNKGLLFDVKSWLEDILDGCGGGCVDLLLHLLGNIASLLVTNEMITSSKVGKLVAAVEKHKICLRMSETPTKKRIAKVKEQWSASVKRMRQVRKIIICVIVFLRK